MKPNIATRLLPHLLVMATFTLADLPLTAQQPFTVNSAPDTPTTSSNPNWSNYTTYALTSSDTYMTGTTVALHWNQADTGIRTGGCPVVGFTSFDNSLSTLYQDAANAGKVVNFIVMPVQEGTAGSASNSYTPAYVETQLWANNLATGGCTSISLSGIAPAGAWPGSFFPLDYIYENGAYWQETDRNISGYSAGCTSGSSKPTFPRNAAKGTVVNNDGNCQWTSTGSSAPPQDVCFSGYYPGDGVIYGDNSDNPGCFNVTNQPSGSSYANLETGFPVSYEDPMKVAWKYFIQQALSHYKSYQPYTNFKIGYIRFGMSQGGEAVPIVSSSWPDFNNPGGGASAQYLSYISDMMAFQDTNNPGAINLLADMNNWNSDATYSDQEALAAIDNNIGIGTNGLQVNDVTSISPPNACSGSTNAVSGDWCYNFSLYCGKPTKNGTYYPICSLQTLLLSDPGNNAAGNTGSLSNEYWNSGSAYADFYGLIPAARKYGATNLEIYTCDILYVSDPSYASSNCATGTTDTGNPADAAFENDYQHAFTAFLTPTAPGIYSPVPGSSTTTDSSLSLAWYANPGATSYTIQIGSSQGSQNYYHSTGSGTAVNAHFSGSATQGSDVWVRWTPSNGSSIDYHYIAQ